jgi:hypothetical protein
MYLYHLRGCETQLAASDLSKQPSCCSSQHHTFTYYYNSYLSNNGGNSNSGGGDGSHYKLPSNTAADPCGESADLQCNRYIIIHLNKL